MQDAAFGFAGFMKLSRFQYKIISKRFYVIFNTFVNIVFFEQVSKTFRLFF